MRRATTAVLWGALGVGLGSLSSSTTGCSSPPTETSEKDVRDRAERLAVAFRHYVDVHYAARLAAEKDATTPAPSPAMRLRAREDLVRALRDVGADLPDAPDDAAALKAAVEAVRRTLVEHDYVFLPLGRGTDAEGGDQGIALAHVRQRDTARRLELWGHKVEYDRVIYEPFVLDYESWRAKVRREQGTVYLPGRYAGSTVYIDFPILSQRAKTLEPPLDNLGLDGLIREVELRQVAYLLFMHDIPQAATIDPVERSRQLVRLYERVLWTTARYGDPDAALADFEGLASGTPPPPPELREAAKRALELIPTGTRHLGSKSARAEVLHGLADEVWPRLRVRE